MSRASTDRNSHQLTAVTGHRFIVERVQSREGTVCDAYSICKLGMDLPLYLSAQAHRSVYCEYGLTSGQRAALQTSILILWSCKRPRSAELSAHGPCGPCRQILGRRARLVRVKPSMGELAMAPARAVPRAAQTWAACLVAPRAPSRLRWACGRLDRVVSTCPVPS